MNRYTKLIVKKDRKSKKRYYFGDEQQDAIIEYNTNPDNFALRNKIYSKIIHPCFDKLAENIINTFKFTYYDMPFEDVNSITRGGDRLDILAHKYYKDKKLWWIIAIANPDTIRRDSFYLEPGLSLRIPYNILPIIDKFEKLN